MRKTTFLLSILFPLALNAQIEFAPLGAIWHYEWPQIGGPVTSRFVKLEVTGTALIQGKLCKKITGNTGGCPDLEDEVVYIYEENGKVYRLLDSVFYLFMDFTAEAGESWEVITKAPAGNDTLIVHVDSVSYVTFNGLQLKVQYVSYPNFAIGFPWGSIMEWGHTFTERLGNSQYIFPQIGVCDPLVIGIRCYSDDTLDLNLVSYPCDTITVISGVNEPEDVRRYGLLFPNPADMTVALMPGIEADEIVFQDIAGSTTLRHSPGSNREMETGDLNPGVYFVFVYRHNKLIGIDKLLIVRR